MKHQTTIRVDEALWSRVLDRAAEDRRSLNGTVEVLLALGLGGAGSKPLGVLLDDLGIKAERVPPEVVKALAGLPGRRPPARGSVARVVEVDEEGSVTVEADPFVEGIMRRNDPPSVPPRQPGESWLPTKAKGGGRWCGCKLAWPIKRCNEHGLWAEAEP